MSKRRVIILGCGGFIGSHLVDRLVADGGYEIFGFDTSSAKIQQHLDHPQFHLQETYIDATNVEQLIGPLLDDCHVVISLAAVCNPAEYVANPVFTISSNFIDAYKLIDLCAARGTWIVHTSTCEVYGRTIASYLHNNQYADPSLYEQIEDATPLVMGPITNQRWSYAAAKALLARYIYANYSEHGMPFTIVRPYNWFGPRMDYIPGHDGEGTPRVLACFMSALLDDKPMQLVDGGTARRTITYIEDATDALMAIVEKPTKSQNQIFNIGNRANEINMADLAQLMRETYAEITGDPRYRNHPIISVSSADFYGPGYEDCDRRVPDVSHAKQCLDWEATTDLRDTLRLTMSHFHAAYAGSQHTGQ